MREKRNRRMVSLTEMTERFSARQTAPEFQAALLKSIPSKVFGKAVAAHITDVRLDSNRLIVSVDNAQWGREIRPLRKRLLDAAREIHPSVKEVVLEF